MLASQDRSRVLLIVIVTIEGSVESVGDSIITDVLASVIGGAGTG
jgi:methanogenic corrinoid protein MtbC1